MPEDLKSMTDDEQRGATITKDPDAKTLFKEHLDGMKRGAASRPAEEE